MIQQFAIVPAVDVLDGRAVRLTQGDYERVDDVGDPFELVRRAAAASPPLIHVVALAAARDGGISIGLAEAVVEVSAPVPVQLGGGVRSAADVSALMDAGVARIVVGTAAFGELPLAQLADAGEICVAVDVADGVVRTAGWRASSGLTVTEALDRCADAGVQHVVCTAIARDGTREGPDLALLLAARAGYDGELLAAGGIRDAGDVEAVRELGLDGVVVGRAWLEGTLQLEMGVTPILGSAAHVRTRKAPPSRHNVGGRSVREA
ncbi:MAG TPA: HisA/HisF-related TIM barrel protein [Gaiellaceae bacterium]|nr:HisA/HisF-related TIM barrel protein [Gaiellaceae bacterium]